MLLVAANSGGPSDPDWLRNLRINPMARVEIGDHNQWVRAEQMSNEEAVAFWPTILQRAPTYSRYLKATSRTIPLVRLVPITLGYEPSP
jgi:deazaflavin-dependent oxidoreductase (nitroreductase family)